MSNPDKRLETLKQIIVQFKNFCEKVGKVSEADTRKKVIDEILIKVLGWDDNDVRREKHVPGRGFMDYELSTHGKKLVVVEAKKEGIPFILPAGTSYSTLTLNGTLLTEKEIKDAIEQVRSYCDEEGIRYAVATNGYSWIVFRAIREDMPWRKGNARVFKSLEYIVDNFTEFYNLLSFEAVTSGMLDSEFGIELTRKRNLHRVTDKLVNSDAPLIRNDLHTQLSPIISYFFEDIIHEENLSAIEKCYVYRATQRVVSHDINSAIKSSIPKFLGNSTQSVEETKFGKGNFGEALSTTKNTDNGQLFLLLGGIGAGKTTFQRRFQLTVGKRTLDENSIWFSIDFLKAPLSPSVLEDFVWKTILEQLRNKYSSLNLEERKNIESAYSHEIKSMQQTSLFKKKPGSEEYEKTLSTQLGLWQNNVETYTPKLLNSETIKRRYRVVIFVDNVDQLEPGYQANIFKLAQRITRLVASTTIVALREESYYTASVRKVFTAYINRQFHIASPPFRYMIGRRIDYCLQLIEGEGELPPEIQQIPPQQRKKICEFLRIVEFSIFEQNRNIARFIDALCFGNMRMALQMFSLFLTSGVTDVDKILRINKKQGMYFVSFHEFLKSIMLDDRFYYKDIRSQIINLFDCGAEKNSSHFTCIRILRLLGAHKAEYTSEGEGFFQINNASILFENVFNNKEDFIRSLNRLVNKQLVETNTKASENIDNATSMRITTSGQYYLEFLMKSFAYLDLIIQDIPFNDEKLANQMTESVKLYGNKGGEQEEKETRMEERFWRVEKLIEYLEQEEKDEIELFRLKQLKESPLTKPIVGSLKNQYFGERDWIKRRMNENNSKTINENLADNTEIDRLLFGNEDDILDPSNELNVGNPDSQ